MVPMEVRHVQVGTTHPTWFSGRQACRECVPLTEIHHVWMGNPHPTWFVGDRLNRVSEGQHFSKECLSPKEICHVWMGTPNLAWFSWTSSTALVRAENP